VGEEAPIRHAQLLTAGRGRGRVGNAPHRAHLLHHGVGGGPAARGDGGGDGGLSELRLVAQAADAEGRLVRRGRRVVLQQLPQRPVRVGRARVRPLPPRLRLLAAQGEAAGRSAGARGAGRVRARERRGAGC
jgi:hypothetical protein